jgi:hypothetical protein
MKKTSDQYCIICNKPLERGQADYCSFCEIHSELIGLTIHEIKTLAKFGNLNVGLPKLISAAFRRVAEKTIPQVRKSKDPNLLWKEV